tara:strand:- start:503 stop:2041 length:1539 start_codon:yes stop_codon:yes gene_type:complete
MASFGSFSSFGKKYKGDTYKFEPVKNEFGGSSPESVYTINRESCWARWRRGFELATASLYHNSFDYPFRYKIPLPQGVSGGSGNAPSIPGIFRGFPTENKELGIHWAGVRVAGSLRFDNVKDTGGVAASIASVTEDKEFWYVQLAGTWSSTNQLPAPLFIPIAGTDGIKPTNGEVIEDRIIAPEGVPINRNTINPNTQTRYGYVQAVLVDVNPSTGLLKLRKRGSVEATPDQVLVTPATRPPNVGRYFMTGTRYYCTCQDFTRREYAYMSSLGLRKSKLFPHTRVATLKPGRYEVMTEAGKVANQAMTNAVTNRKLEIVSPSIEYEIPPTVVETSSTVLGATRDNPGVFSDFGGVYLRSGADPSLPGARSEGLPDFEDYKAKNNVITSLTDRWTPTLDEFRYCKHIYSMKYEEGVFPPEPSDLPVEITNITEWEQKLVNKVQKDQEGASININRYGLSYMDIPPFNCQSPMMVQMMQKLFNIPTSFVLLQNFTMYDKTGKAYTPSQGGTPAL